jgi:hypothetical protein
MSGFATGCCSDASSGVTAKETPPVTRATTSCPGCGQAGQHVPLKTLRHHVKPTNFCELETGSFYFCPSAKCDVFYFNKSGTILRETDVRQPIGSEESGDTVFCYCFGFTKAMVLREIRATGRCTIPQQIALEVKAGNCACSIFNPQGSCCLGTVAKFVKEATLSRLPESDEHEPSK